MSQENAANNNTKQFHSVFVPEQLIDLPNFIAELMIRNWLLINKKPVPNCPFWRKDIASRSAELQDLSKRYVAELTAAKKLLCYFGPGVIMKYYQESKMPGFTMVKDETKGKILLELFKRQNKEKESLFQDKSSTVQKREEVQEVDPVPTIWNNERAVSGDNQSSPPVSSRSNKFSQL